MVAQRDLAPDGQMVRAASAFPHALFFVCAFAGRPEDKNNNPRLGNAPAQAAIEDCWHTNAISACARTAY